MLTAILIVACVQLAVSIADLIIDVRAAKPVRKRALQGSLAEDAVAAAEQRFGPGAGPDKARYARQFLMDAAKVSPVRADALVENAVAKLKKQ